MAGGYAGEVGSLGKMNVDLLCRGPRGLEQQVLTPFRFRREARYVITFHPGGRKDGYAMSVERRKFSVEAEGDGLCGTRR